VRIAIFSDVHGNLTALDAVLAHIEQQSPDLIAFAGDLCLFGPRPAACLDQVRQRPIVTIYGNTDEWVLEPPQPPEGPADRVLRHRQHLHEIGSWTQAQLNQADRDWLGAFPFEHRVSPTDSPKDDLLIVHANPRDVNQVIFPSEARQKEIFGDVQQKQSDEDLADLLTDVPARVIAFGHLHVPNVRQWHEVTLANISSVSLPGDLDTRAKYGLLTWDKREGWSVAHQYVTYDIDQEVAALEEYQLPNWQTYARRLRASVS
jgi:predicted phosphodiesterase